MSSKVDFIRKSVVGGVFFLIPLAIVLIVIGKLVDILRTFADKVVPMLPAGSTAGIIAINLVALLIIIFFCFLAGLVSLSPKGKKIREQLEQTLLAILPGYSFVKGLSENLSKSEEIAESFTPVAVKFDDYAQLAFEIERLGDESVAVYLPGAPNPWSGSVIYVTSDRVRKLDMSIPEAIKNIGMLGKGSMEYIDHHGKVF